jgi:hypothetical protein
MAELRQNQRQLHSREQIRNQSPRSHQHSPMRGLHLALPLRLRPSRCRPRRCVRRATLPRRRRSLRLLRLRHPRQPGRRHDALQPQPGRGALLQPMLRPALGQGLPRLQQQLRPGAPLLLWPHQQHRRHGLQRGGHRPPQRHRAVRGREVHEAVRHGAMGRARPRVP